MYQDYQLLSSFCLVFEVICKNKCIHSKGFKLFTYQKYNETMIKYVDEEHVSTKTADAEFNVHTYNAFVTKKQLPQVRNY